MGEVLCNGRRPGADQRPGEDARLCRSGAAECYGLWPPGPPLCLRINAPVQTECLGCIRASCMQCWHVSLFIISPHQGSHDVQHMPSDLPRLQSVGFAHTRRCRDIHHAPRGCSRRLFDAGPVRLCREVAADYSPPQASPHGSVAKVSEVVEGGDGAVCC